MRSQVLFSKIEWVRLGILLATLSSGISALMYEVLWTRSLAIILGSTVPAGSAVFASFMLGSGLGAYWVIRWKPKGADHLRTYSAVELGIMLLAPMTGWILHHWRESLATYAGSPNTDFYLLQTTLVALCMTIVPTVLIGATFPILLAGSRRFTSRISLIGRIYGFNILGGAVGVLLAGFLTIRLVGVLNSYLVAASLNAISALICLLIWRTSRAQQQQPPTIERTHSPDHPIPDRILILTAFTSGLLVLSCEVIWFRLASFLLGNRTYALSTLLFCMLFLLAFSALLVPPLLRRYQRRATPFIGYALLASVCLIPLSTWGASLWIQWQDVFEALLPRPSVSLVPFRIFVTLIALSPMMLPLGLLFPMSLSLSRRSQTELGYTAGTFYLVNSIGAAAGALVTGHWLLSTFGTLRSSLILSIVCVALASTFFVFTFGRSSTILARTCLLSSIAALALLFAVAPSRMLYLRPGEDLLHYREDNYGVFQVIRERSGFLKVRNNKMKLMSRLGDKEGNFVQQMLGHLGMLYLDNAKTALVVGGGYGITTGSLAAYPELAAIDSIEILPGMIESADFFEPYNLGYHKDPRVRIFQEDGRHFLARTDARYDVITVNVTDPLLPGASTLFHKEFYELVKRRLRPNGVFVQAIWNPGLKIMLNTIRHSFAHVVRLPVWSNSYIIVASDAPLRIRDGGSPLFDDHDLGTARALLGHSATELKKRLGKIEPLPNDSKPGDEDIASDTHPRLEFLLRTRGGPKGWFTKNYE